MKIYITAIRKHFVTEQIIFYSIVFLFPLVFNQAQIITGSVINGMLFLASVRLHNKNFIPLAVLPSIGALAHGVLFGTFTMYLVYFLPFIWISNYFLLLISRTKQLTVLTVGISALMKGILLYTVAYVFVYIHLVPKLFLTVMGPIQVLTAILGGIGVMGIKQLIPRYDRN